MTKEYHTNHNSMPQHLLAFMDEEADRLRTLNHLGLADNYNCAKRSFQRYLLTRGASDIALNQVSAPLMSGYQEWLLSGQLGKNTTSFYMRNLQAAYNKAVRRGLVAAPSYPESPFSDVYTGVAETRKRAVPSAIIAALSHLDIKTAMVAAGQNPEHKAFPRILHKLSFARDTFIFCFCARGLPFIDFTYLRKECLKDGFICYDRHKTGQHIEVEIIPMMQAIINRYANPTPYVFPILTTTNEKEAYHQYRSAIRKYNRLLAVLSQMLGHNVKLTTYVARHSWATAAYHGNIPVAYISEAMGHNNESTTRKYLKSLGENRLNQANKKLLRTIFSNAL